MELCNGQIKYLIAIHQLQDTGEKVKCVTIANYLKVSRPSVSKTLRCLADSGLVYKNFCNSVEFTEEGKKVVEELMKNYNEIYIFFNQFLKLESELAKEHSVKFITSFPQNTCDKLSSLIISSLKKKSKK
ncbi:MAG: ArsR family transcriptional regulator [Oscillospiraceae bacterium]|nr:ArsR family transcriptional regulator [Oscillospiraceae bacterium]